MIMVKCIKKFKDSNEKIYGYRLQDLNGMIKDITSEQLKTAIVKGQIIVSNLTLTKDDRLVDSKEKQLNNINELNNKDMWIDMYDSTFNEICSSLGFKYNKQLVKKCNGHEFLSEKPIYNSNDNIDALAELYYNSDNSKDKLVYKASRKIMNTYAELIICIDAKERKNIAVNEYLRIDLGQIHLVIMFMQTIKELVEKMDKTSDYFKTHIDEFISIMNKLSHYDDSSRGSCFAMDGKIYPQLIKLFSENMNITNEVKKYFTERKAKILKDNEFIDRLNYAHEILVRDATSYAININDIDSYSYLIKYCVLYNDDLHTIPSTSRFVHFIDGLRIIE